VLVVGIIRYVIIDTVCGLVQLTPYLESKIIKATVAAVICFVFFYDLVSMLAQPSFVDLCTGFFNDRKDLHFTKQHDLGVFC